MIADFPDNEGLRLFTLESLNLDTAAEKSFDDITRFAAALCETPTAFVSLVHRERQWFKSRVGLEISETPRDYAFCAHTILGTGILEVEDASLDLRFCENPLVTASHGIRFYAGAPLVHPNGSALGALCVTDTHPRRLTSVQRQGLSLLADQVVQTMILRHRLARETSRLGPDLEQILERSTDAILITDVRGSILSWNPAATRIFGYTSGEVLGQQVSFLVPLDLREHHVQGMERFARTGQAQQMGKVLELQALHKDGRKVDIELSLSRSWILDQPGVMAVVRDISARRRVEAERQRLRQRYRLTLEAVADAVVAVDPQGVVELANPAAAELVGEPAETLVGRPWNEVLTFVCTRPDQRGCVPLKRWQEGLLHERASEHAMLRRKDGAIRIVSYTLAPVPEAAGTSVVVSIRDVTEQQEQWNSLQEQRARLDSVLATTGAVIYSARLPDMTVDFVSESVVTMLGYPVETVKSPGFWQDILHPQDAAQVMEGQTRMFATGHVVQEYRLRHKAGYPVWVRDEVRLVWDEEGKPLRAYGASFDISGRKRDDHMLRTMLAVREIVTVLMRRSLEEQLRDPEALLVSLLGELATAFGAPVLEIAMVTPERVDHRHRWGGPSEGTTRALQLLETHRSLLTANNPLVLYPDPALGDWVSLVTVPLRMDAQDVLVLTLANVEDDPIALEDVLSLLAPVAEAYDAAFKRHQIALQLQAANQRLETTSRLHREVFGLSSQASNCKSRAELLDLLTRRIGEVSRARWVSIVERLPGEEADQHTLLYAVVPPVRMQFDPAYAAVPEVLHTGLPLSSRLYGHRRYSDWASLAEQGIPLVLNCPLVTAEGVYGSLNFGWGPEVELTQEEEEVYTQLALVIGAHLQVYRSLGQLTDVNSKLEYRVQQRTAALRRSEERFQRLFEESPVPLLLLQEEMVAQVNHAAAELLRQDREALLNRPFSLQIPTASAPILLEMPSPTGGMTTVELRRTEIELEQGDSVLVSLSDIGAHIAAQQQAEKSLFEKETLLKEIHHRVKNNLQIISSLLSMQGRMAGELDARTLLQDSVMRIRSMALIHEQLYQADQLSRIHLGDYIRQLSRYLRLTLQPEAGFEIDVQSDEVWMTVENAVPCGLVMNELIVNSLKHGSRPGNPCRICIQIRMHGEEIVLTISDNGPGLPADFLSPERRSFGLRLVSTLVQQLRGTFTLERTSDGCAGRECIEREQCSAHSSQGTCVCLRIPNVQLAASP